MWIEHGTWSAIRALAFCSLWFKSDAHSVILSSLGLIHGAKLM